MKKYLVLLLILFIFFFPINIKAGEKVSITPIFQRVERNKMDTNNFFHFFRKNNKDYVILPEGKTVRIIVSGKTAYSTYMNWESVKYNGNKPNIINGVLDDIEAEITEPVIEPDFTISGSPSSRTIQAGDSTIYFISVRSINGFHSRVNLLLSGLPSNTTYSFNNLSGIPTFSSTLRIRTSRLTPPGTYTLTITGTGGGKTHLTSVRLIVNQPPPNTYQLTVRVNPSGHGVVTVSYDGNSYSVTTTKSFNIKENTRVTLSATSSGGYEFDHWSGDISGTNTTVSFVMNEDKDVTANFSFIVKPDFTISTTPSSRTIQIGDSTTYSVSVRSINGFYSYVSLSVSGLPSNTTWHFTEPSGVPTFSTTLHINTFSSTPPGTYTLTIIGIGGGKIHSTSVVLVVTSPPPPPPEPDFTISATPSLRTIQVRDSTTYSVSVKSLNGFSDTVNLSVSGLPSNTTYSFSNSSGIPDFSSILTINTSSSTSPGTYTLTITGEGGGKRHTTTVDLVVSPPPQHQLTVRVNPSNSGTVSVSYGGEEHTVSSTSTFSIEEGTRVYLTASANTSYEFSDWSGDIISSNEEVSVVMDSDKDVTANFVKNYVITATAGPGGKIEPSGSVVVNEGEDKTFVITANPGFEIKEVKVDGEDVGPVSEYTFYNVNSDHTIEASFESEPTGSLNLSAEAVLDEQAMKNHLVHGLALCTVVLSNGQEVSCLDPNWDSSQGVYWDNGTPIPGQEHTHIFIYEDEEQTRTIQVLKGIKFLIEGNGFVGGTLYFSTTGDLNISRTFQIDTEDWSFLINQSVSNKNYRFTATARVVVNGKKVAEVSKKFVFGVTAFPEAISPEGAISIGGVSIGDPHHEPPDHSITFNWKGGFAPYTLRVIYPNGNVFERTVNGTEYTWSSSMVSTLAQRFRGGHFTWYVIDDNGTHSNSLEFWFGSSSGDNSSDDDSGDDDSGGRRPNPGFDLNP